MISAAMAFSLLGLASAASAQVVNRLPGTEKQPFALAVAVPPGFTTYYISGTGGGPGNTEVQTRMALSHLKDVLTKEGLTFGDVVEAHVFLVGDPANGGKMDFAGMNKAWFEQFGTPTQPNKPARAAFQIAALAGAAGLVEIEFIAAKKAK
jgi:enamine deaminase RidA (YjgF/YER057c/UK114 family)